MDGVNGDGLYSTILRWALVPVLALVLGLCWIVTNILMSTKWQQARRAKQIRKAQQLRARRAAERDTPDDNDKPDSSGSGE